MKKFIGWLIVLSIFGGLGYLIYQNGGIPSEGFNIGEIIGSNSPEGMYLAINGCTIGADGTSIIPTDGDEQKQVYTPEKPEEYPIVQLLQKIDNYAGQRLYLGYGLLYHIDRPEHHQHYNDGGIEYITALTGITDFSNIVGASYSSNATPNVDGAYIDVLIEFRPEADVENIANEIKNQIVPSELEIGADEFNQFFDALTTEDVHVSFRENYVYIVIIGQDMIGLNKSVKPETLVDTFQKIELE